MNFSLLNLFAEILQYNCVTIVIYYILVSFKYWCTDCVKMAEFCRNV
jgi:uncharacterized membrane protein YwzB